MLETRPVLWNFFQKWTSDWNLWVMSQRFGNDSLEYISQWLIFGLQTETVNLTTVFLVLLKFLWRYFEKKFMFFGTITLQFSLSCSNLLLMVVLTVVLTGLVFINHVSLFYCIFWHFISCILHCFEKVCCFSDPCLHSLALKQQKVECPNTKCSDKDFDADDFWYHFKVIYYHKDYFVIKYW